MQTGSRFALLLTFFFSCFSSFSQSSGTFTLQVQVTDDREAPLPGSYVLLPDQNRVATTDRSGQAQLSLPAGTYTVVTSFIGYATDTTEVDLQGNQTIAVRMEPEPLTMEEAVVSATRASRVTPIPHQEFSAEDLDKLNEGVDLPILLDQATSVVTTSDAGAGVGYTGIRIRGSDPTRINVTVNGIPLNDAESQGVFWVNMPDFASSVSSIQIQRGVGTSTNGAGAFGATVNLNTIETKNEAYGIYSGAVGSFNTFKNTVEFGSGLINESFTIDGRLSRITSDGFIDRASSELQSYYLSAGYVHKKTFLKFITFRGHERTYQAWYGVPQSRLDAGERTYNPYDYPDQVDDYGQTHYQLHLTQEITPELRITAAGHYTIGAGFFEEYKGDQFNQGIFNGPQNLVDYGMAPVIIGNEVIRTTNLIRRRWLENDYYGGVFSVQYRPSRWEMVWGGGFHRYEGDHFGEVIWSEYSSNVQKDHRYYEGSGTKNDANTYAKASFEATKRVRLFADLQYRYVGYETAGTDNDLRTYDVEDDLHFFNPKAGVFVDLTANDKLYGSVAIGNREPSRNDYVDRPTGADFPDPETLIDYELGYQRLTGKYRFSANAYYMDYQNQLILTGEVNDVGAALRQNVDNSYRAGIELEAAWRPVRFFEWSANATFSQNKIDRITQSVYHWDTDNYPDPTEIEYTDTDIAFSPSVIAGNVFEFTLPGFLRSSELQDEAQVALITKYVGEQFLDNTQSDLRKLDAYVVNDLRLSYHLRGERFKEVSVNLLIRNVFDALYSANGWVYRFRHPDDAWGAVTDGNQYAERDTEVQTGDPNDVYYFERAFFPQAGTHFLLGLNIHF